MQKAQIVDCAALLSDLPRQILSYHVWYMSFFVWRDLRSQTLATDRMQARSNCMNQVLDQAFLTSVTYINSRGPLKCHTYPEVS